MSILDTKINTVASIALNTATILANNYYDKDFVESALIGLNGGEGVINLLTQYYNRAYVDTLLTNYQSKGNYLTSGSLIGYATTGSIPTKYLTSGSLVGYAQLINPTFEGTITTNFINMITPATPNDVIISGKFVPTAGQLSAQLS